MVTEKTGMNGDRFVWNHNFSLGKDKIQIDQTKHEAWLK